MEYIRLGDSGLKVSKIILGCMTFGSPTWQNSPWTLGEEEGLRLLKKAYDLGINTWDTADMYSNGESERIVGKALKKYGIPRSKVVILTKIYNPVNDGKDERLPSVNDGGTVNQMGLSRKHVFAAVDNCLKRLGTDYIGELQKQLICSVTHATRDTIVTPLADGPLEVLDVLQIHRLDRETPPEEIMRALHEVVLSGKVRYIGGGSMWTWEFARLQHIAELRGWTKFVSMQNYYNLVYREEEREMIPFCKATGVAVLPWSPLARGLLTRPVGKKESARSQRDKLADKWNATANLEIVDRVEKLAQSKGVSMAVLSTAWVIEKGCIPILGLNTEARIEEIVQALKVALTDEDMDFLESEYKPRAKEGF